MARIYSTDWEIDARLQEVFGVTRAALFQVVREVVGARSDAVDDDPVTAAGLLAYIHGTRNTRAIFRAIGWVRHRFNGVEAVKHPTRELTVAYQSVDLAATTDHSPKAISGKGPGAERMIDLGQGSLFPKEYLDALDKRQAEADNRSAWFFCVSVNGDDDVRAELSLASGVSGGNFAEFFERIFIVRPGEWAGIRLIEPSASEVVEFEPEISRK